MLPLLVAAVPTSPARSSCDLGSGPMMQLMGISSAGDLGNAGIGRQGREEGFFFYNKRKRVVVWRRELWVD
jgi:hypothetical protein